MSNFGGARLLAFNLWGARATLASPVSLPMGMVSSSCSYHFIIVLPLLCTEHHHCLLITHSLLQFGTVSFNMVTCCTLFLYKVTDLTHNCTVGASRTLLS